MRFMARELFLGNLQGAQMGECVYVCHKKRRANLLSSKIASGNSVNGLICVESFQMDKYTSSEVCYTVQMFQSTRKDNGFFVL